MEYVNRDTQRRVWPALRGPGGSTLELGPGESVDLALVASFRDPYLKAKARKAKVAKGLADSEPKDEPVGQSLDNEGQQL